MAKAFNPKRIIFFPGVQRGFLGAVEQKLTISKMAGICHLSERTVRDWRREKFSMNFECFKKLCEASGIPRPKNTRIRNQYSHMKKAAAEGWQAVRERYGRVPGNEAKRKEAWSRWWKTKGPETLPRTFKSRIVYKPKKSKELAEFIGIMMGDGGLSKYQVIVTLHHIDDRAYAKFVMRRVQELFNVTPRIYHSPKYSVNDIVVSRIELVHYLHSLGLPIGNKVKQGLDIPRWIKQNRSYAIACLRGLMDTDGSVIRHRYRAKNKWYEYKKLSFTSASAPLRESAGRILFDLGVKPRLSGSDVRLDSRADVQKYFAVVGSHNPKHLKRYTK